MGGGGPDGAGVDGGRGKGGGGGSMQDLPEKIVIRQFPETGISLALYRHSPRLGSPGPTLFLTVLKHRDTITEHRNR